MKEFIKKTLQEKGISPSIILRYEEPHRFYHNLDHIIFMITKAISLNILTEDLFLAIVFHDIIYDPKATDNEEKSAEYFYSFIKNDEVKQAILETKTHKPTSELSKQLCELDLTVLNSDFGSFIEFENKIFKEYQWVDYKIYRHERMRILASLGVKQEWIDYVEYRKPNIALYVGSFNPFHKGHFNVVEKAEKIFDKVILARGINPEKKNEIVPLPDYIQYRQVDSYDGLLTDYIDSLGYEVTLIRGLRNATDLEYEKTQCQFLKDLKPDIKVVSIFCDKEYEHVSSSAIRSLNKFGKGDMYL